MKRGSSRWLVPTC